MGASAPRNSPSGETPSGKYFDRMDWPAGFGALAMTVKPPPAHRPRHHGVFHSGVKVGTRLER